MKIRSTTGMVRHIHLARSARLAGEAFAFAEPEPVGRPVRRLPVGGLAVVFLAAAALASLYLLA